jgi:NAD(P)H dehydrogenase (quinone)
MAKILVLTYSSWGHTDALAKAVIEGARGAGAEVTHKRVPELVPEAVRHQFHYKTPDVPEATVDELPSYDAIIFGTPTRFGNMAAQMRNFLDQTGGLWQKGALHGKVASVFVSTGTGGGNETTQHTFMVTLAHHGMIYVPIGYAEPALMDDSEFHGGSPFGAGTIAGPTGGRMPTENELKVARFQGAHVARVAAKLFG